MRIIGHGIDATGISGIKDQVDAENKTWAELFCSNDERALSDSPPGHYRYYAGRFAAKEAVVKALGTGFCGAIRWDGIEVLHREGGAPFIRLSGDVKLLAEELGIRAWFISISYTAELAIASVIAVGD